MGFILADGNVYHRKDGRYAVSVSQKDPIHLQKMCEFVGNGTVGRRTRNGKVWYVATWYDAEAARHLSKWNCTQNKSLTLAPPEGIPSEQVRHLIRGYNDGDGGVYPSSRRIRMRGTEGFLLWVRDNLPYKSMVYPQGETAQLFTHGANAIENAKFLYENARTFMDRKAAAAAELASLSYGRHKPVLTHG